MGRGENIAWGSGSRSTPRSIVRAWMASDGHWANILSAAFRDIGIGVSPGAPVVGGRPRRDLRDGLRRARLGDRRARFRSRGAGNMRA